MEALVQPREVPDPGGHHQPPERRHVHERGLEALGAQVAPDGRSGSAEAHGGSLQPSVQDLGGRPGAPEGIAEALRGAGADEAAGLADQQQVPGPRRGPGEEAGAEDGMRLPVQAPPEGEAVLRESRPEGLEAGARVRTRREGHPEQQAPVLGDGPAIEVGEGRIEGHGEVGRHGIGLVPLLDGEVGPGGMGPAGGEQAPHLGPRPVRTHQHAGAHLRDPPSLAQAQPKAIVPPLQADQFAPEAPGDIAGHEGHQPAVEALAVDVDVEPLVAALQADGEIQGPHDEELGSRQHLAGQAQPEAGEHGLGVGGDEPAAGLPCPGFRILQVAAVHQED